MPVKTISAQKVNGDPLQDDGNINIITNKVVLLSFDEIDKLLHDPTPGETITVDGVPGLTYQFLGYGYVRGDPQHEAAFIRINEGNGKFTTVAIDMNGDGDGEPTLPNGNTKLHVSDLTQGPPQSFPAPACFTPGTWIEAARGLVPIETLVPGEAVRTRDHGMQVLRWIGGREVPAQGDFAPVVFAPGVLGNPEPLVVSQRHRVLVTGWRAELFAGEDEVLVAAKHLANGRDVVLRSGGRVRYIHLLFDRHEILRAGGVWSESYFPAHAAERGDAGLRAELSALYPELQATVSCMTAARRVAKRHEAACLVA